jgi:polyvinyl alcohol dehydrogenase (cytochrome)
MLARSLLLSAIAGIAPLQAGAQSKGEAAEAAATTETPAQLYTKYCSECHGGRVQRAPDKWFLQMMPADLLLAAMESGVMRQQAAALTTAQRTQIAEYLAGSAVPPVPKLPPACTGRAANFDYSAPPFAVGWGVDFENRRYISRDVAGLLLSDIPKLELAWAFGYPNATRARSQPSFTGGAVMVGSQDGTVYALDAASGCLRFKYRAGAEVRTGITITPWRRNTRPARVPAYFADLNARVYAIDAVSGREVWVRKVDDHPHATVTAQPLLHDGRLYVTVSSREVMSAADPRYECCSFRGSVSALDATSGEVLWKTYVIPEEPRRVGANAAGTPILAPSGAAVWNTPTLDASRGLLYVGTGQNYSAPAQGSSDAIVALEIASGKIRWVRQTLAGDAWNAVCIKFIPNKANCPANPGPDLDYGSPPMLLPRAYPAPSHAASSGDLLVAGQKSGDIYGIDPSSGMVRWHTAIGRGGNQGGQHFGMAAQGGRAFVPITDNDEEREGTPAPGLHAVDVQTGELIWSALADDVCGQRKFCDPGISAAVTAIDGAVFAGHLDGRMRAYDSATGRVLWEVSTDREFATVSGVPGHGGSFAGAGGPMIVGGRLYVNSGYGHSYHMPGNVLLVYGARR